MEGTGPRHSAQVLVVGAGGSGMAAAIELRRWGVDVIVIDALEGPRPESRALGLQPRTYELLDRYGISEGLIAGRQSVPYLITHVNQREVGRVDFSMASSRFCGPPTIAQAFAETALREHLVALGVEIRWNHKLVAIDDAASRIVTRIEGPHGPFDLACDWVIGADGARSSVRKLKNLAFAGETYPEGWGLMDANLEWDLPPDAVRMYRMEGPQVLGIVPIDGKTSYRIQYNHRLDEVADTPPTLEEMQEVFDRLTGVKGTLTNPIWASNYNLHRRLVESYRSGRAILVGDACHIHTPAGGQGLNTGIQDGINLGWKLALVVTGIARERLIDTYEEERYPIAEGVLELSETLAKRPATLVDPKQVDPRALANRISQLLVNYRDGPLGAPLHAGALTAGDVVPDVEVDGQLFYHALRKARVLIVTFGVSDDAMELPDNWDNYVEIRSFEAPNALADAIGLEEGAVVVRPDAYLGNVSHGPVEGAFAECLNWLRSNLCLQ